MNRKQFIESHGGECSNWNWSWSFVNHQEKFVIFGAWDNKHTQDGQLILDDEWERNHTGRKLSGFTQAIEHIRLIEEEGYQLKVFTIYYSDDNQDSDGNGPAKIEDFEPALRDKYLLRTPTGWVASDYVSAVTLPEQIEAPKIYFEGAVSVLTVNSYERNAEARQACLDHKGYQCAACEFDFEKTYGQIGKQYIHVHHTIPLHTIRKEYQVNPIEDLVPLCANCHAMIHRKKPALSVDELKQILCQNKVSG